MVTIKEHEYMQLGTTHKFKSGKVCHWHLVASSAYSSMKRINIKVEGRITDSVIKLYNGMSFTDILENGPSNVRSLKPGDNDVTYSMD